MDQQTSSTLPASASKPNAACNRCRGQKLRCVRIPGADRCTRCDRADAPCIIPAPRPMGRPPRRKLSEGDGEVEANGEDDRHSSNNLGREDDLVKNDAVGDKAFPLVEDQTQKILQLSEVHMGIHHFQLRIQRLGKARDTLSTPETEVVHLTGSDVGQMLAYLTDLETLAIKLHLLPTPSKRMDQPLFHLALSSYARLHQVISLVVDLLTTPSDAAPLQLETAGNLGATLRVGDFAVAMDAKLQRSLVIRLCEQNLAIVEQRMKASSGT